MQQIIGLRRLAALWLLIGLLASGVAAQTEEKKEAKKKDTPQGTPVLWEAVDIPSRNLYLGPGGAEMRPDLQRVTFLEDEKGGYSTKYRVRDASGREWVAKVGSEAQSETAAVRLVWALGYKSEINYLVPKLTIEGKGTFTNVRLEARPAGVKRGDEWQWKENPFTGTNELQGLKIMMALLNNWDIKDDNNKILAVKGADAPELHYVISDLGATFGKTGSLPLLWRVQRSRNKPEDYEDAKFVSGVTENRVKFHYGGKMRELFDDISLEQARWLNQLLSQLSADQIRDAFRAANYTPEEITLLTDAVMYRIEQLKTATETQQAAAK